MPQWPYLPDSFGHLRVGCVWRLGPTLHPPKGCANAALNCRDPTIVAWSFADYQFAHWQWVLQLNHDRFVMYGCCIDERETSVSYVFAGRQPKEAEKKWRWIGASKSDVLESRDCVLLTFVYIFILKWMDLENPFSFQIVWGPKPLRIQPTRLIREWNSFNMFRIARTLVVSVKFSSMLLDLSSWR